ncbi:transcription factor bHLH117 [Vigna radiata var. radiata]|uniref:Transcription factor bHLH117 n=1 Tax=Vigna radiata var. radiata TaxID=3916 RepID=A0A1S3U3T4_VIGRR|nr:transcription factor bHLH117 [Vigna radiata var. radiata]
MIMYSGDGSSLDPMFSGTSLQSLLSLNPSLFADGFPTLASLTDDPTLIPQPAEAPKVLVPKTEPSQPFKFFPQYHPSPFLRLPQLRSAEQPQPKRQRLESPVIPQSNLARQRRQKLSEKTRCLQKLMPWDKKMDQGTLLEEAYKYVRFLQAQFRVLQSMPSHSSSSLPSFRQNSAVFVDLEKLNRSQLLQVLVNSPVAQTMLYSQGFCVFSLEQLSLLRKLSDRRHHHHNHLSSKSTFN